MRKLIEQLRSEQSIHGLNLERCKKALDQNVYSARLSQRYRLILVRPEQESVSLLVWVDRHDDAYQWAQRRRFVVNQVTGTLQMWTSSTTKTEPTSSAPALFDQVSDSELLQLGVPEEFLTTVREIKTIQEFKHQRERFPTETYEYLDLLVNDEPLQDVLEFAHEIQRERRKPKARITFQDAIQSPKSCRSIMVVSSDIQLNEILEQPLERWRVFLHPRQKEVVGKSYRGPIRVLGGAGTGKTVIAMHRARHLVRSLLNSNERVLFTTFSVTLALHIRQMLESMCQTSEMKRLDVIAIDALAKQIVESQYGPIRRMGSDHKVMVGIWSQALKTMDWSHQELSFVRSEYERVIQLHGIESLTQYQLTPRVGRKKSISQAMKKKIWDTVQEVKKQKKQKKVWEYIDVLREARKLAEAQDVDPRFAYRSGIIDEAQDIHQEGFKLLRALIPQQDNDLFIVGDAHQRIFSRQVVLGQCGISVKGRRSKRLRINYRTTEEIRRKAVEMIDQIEFDNLDGGKDQETDISLLSGKAPEIITFESQKEEQDFVIEQVNQLQKQGVAPNEIAILAPLHVTVNRYLKRLEEEQIDAQKLSPQMDRQTPKVQCGTMHNSKGLEFRIVFLVEVNADHIPLYRVLTQKKKDPDDYQEYLNQQRSLLYVALTRAREQATITSFGSLSRFVQP